MNVISYPHTAGFAQQQQKLRRGIGWAVAFVSSAFCCGMLSMAGLRESPRIDVSYQMRLMTGPAIERESVQFRGNASGENSSVAGEGMGRNHQ